MSRTFLIAVLVVAGCSGSPTATTAVESASATTSTSSPDSSITSTEPLRAAEALDSAVNALLDADSYAFQVSVEITVQGTVVHTEIVGWVDGRDRELTLKAEGDEVTTRVIDGVATVERDGDSIEVPLQEASDAPSLEILTALRDPRFDGDEVTGSLISSDLKEVGFDVKGAANVVAYLDESGWLAGYVITGNNKSWTIATTFSDVGTSFSTE